MKGVLVAVGLAGLALGAMTLLMVGSAGFPDGYISPYDRSTAILVYGLAFALLLAGIVVLVAGVMGKTRRGVAGVAIVILAWGGLYVLENCGNLGWCPSIYAQLTGAMFDDGQGG